MRASRVALTGSRPRVPPPSLVCSRHGIAQLTVPSIPDVGSCLLSQRVDSTPPRPPRPPLMLMLIRAPLVLTLCTLLSVIRVLTFDTVH